VSYPCSDSWLSDPTEEKACHSDTELDTREIAIEMFEYFLCEYCPFFSLFDFEFELREAYLHKREFTRYKKCVENYERDGYEDSTYYSETGVRVHSSVL
jgi:hypothetical protein